MKRLLSLSLTLTLAVLFVAPTYAGLSKATKCEAGKLGEAGKYASCLLKAQSKAKKKGTAVDTAKCDAKFEAKWAKHEAKAGGECPTELDKDTIKAEIAEQAGIIAGCVSGGSCSAGCLGDLGTCLDAVPSICTVGGGIWDSGTCAAPPIDYEKACFVSGFCTEMGNTFGGIPSELSEVECQAQGAIEGYVFYEGEYVASDLCMSGCPPAASSLITALCVDE